MINHWLGIALVAYLIGAAIEGISTASQLFDSLPEIINDIQSHSSNPDDHLKHNWRVFVVLASVSACGACIWPCRLLHRLIKTTGVSKDLQD